TTTENPASSRLDVRQKGFEQTSPSGNGIPGRTRAGHSDLTTPEVDLAARHDGAAGHQAERVDMALHHMTTAIGPGLLGFHLHGATTGHQSHQEAQIVLGGGYGHFASQPAKWMATHSPCLAGRADSKFQHFNYPPVESVHRL